MDLIADTSTVIAELLRARGRALLRHPEITRFTTVEIHGEIRHETTRRARFLAARQRLSVAEATALTRETLHLFADAVRVVPTEIYAPLAPEARTRIADPQDWSAVALALVTGAGIWTEDRDFFGIGLPVWRTSVLLSHLGLA